MTIYRCDAIVETQKEQEIKGDGVVERGSEYSFREERRGGGEGGALPMR
jgi:hypothetical protein